MIDLYFVDEISIVTYSASEYGKTTRTEKTGVSAKIEDKKKYTKTPLGIELLSDTVVIISASESIDWHNKIKITKRHGTAVKDAGKEYVIKDLSLLGGFTASHYEVYV